jgi:hypothetical protein
VFDQARHDAFLADISDDDLLESALHDGDGD